MLNNIKLKPNSDLLDANFDGYKLYSESFQHVSAKNIEHGISKCTVPEPNCYLYTRMESLHNHLVFDPFDIYNLYVFNGKGHLMMFTFNERYLSCLGVVWQEDLHQQVGSERNTNVTQLSLSPSLLFPTSTYAVTSNGCGTLNILQTGDRSSAMTWINVLEMTIAPGSIVHTLYVEHSQEMHILILSITTPADLTEDSLNNLNTELFKGQSAALHLIYWLTFSYNDEKWLLTRERRVAGFKSLEFIALDSSASEVVSLCHDRYFFIYDSKQPETLGNNIPLTVKQPPRFIFSQSNEEINLFINIGSDVTKNDLIVNISDQHVEVKIKNDVILNHKLLHKIESCAVTWNLEKEKLEINMPKVELLLWEHLLEGGNQNGEEVSDKTLNEEVHQKLAHLTSDKWNPDPELDKPAYNPGQLEACDDAAEDLIITMLDGDSHCVSHTAHLGAVQHLFNTQMAGDPNPLFCLRHDVDGVLWALKEDKTFEHISTFNAFGYVKASKTMAKFTRASPDNSYVAIADVNSHVYVFCQPETLGSELRNRKSGKRTTTVARQMILSLRNHDEVMGFHCTPLALFVLNSEELIAYSFCG